MVLKVFVKEGLIFAWDLPLENSTDSHLCFQLALLHDLLHLGWLTYGGTDRPGELC